MTARHMGDLSCLSGITYRLCTVLVGDSMFWMKGAAGDTPLVGRAWVCVLMIRMPAARVLEADALLKLIEISQFNSSTAQRRA